jgi:hypothetical protein
MLYAQNEWGVCGKWLRIGEMGRISGNMCICSKISQPLVICKVFNGMSCHGSKLLGWMAALVGVVHAMIAIWGAMATLATNLARRVLAWRWGSTGEGVPGQWRLGSVVGADSLERRKGYDISCVEMGVGIGQEVWGKTWVCGSCWGCKVVWISGHEGQRNLLQD